MTKQNFIIKIKTLKCGCEKISEIRYNLKFSGETKRDLHDPNFSTEESYQLSMDKCSL